MDWHPVISVQQQTPGNDFCHFSISNVRFAFLDIFSKTGKKPGLHTGSKWWPGDPDVKDDPNDPLTRWPNDPVPCLLLTAHGVAHLVVHGTSGSTSYETIPPVRLETSGGVLSTVDMVVQRRDGPRWLRDNDDDDDESRQSKCEVGITQS